MRPNILSDFAAGKATWAQVEGMTQLDATEIAELACEFAARGRLEHARVLLEGLVVGNPLDAGAAAALGTVYQKLERTDEAMVQYNAALGVDPAHPVALANRGELRLRLGDVAGLGDLTEAIRLDRGLPLAAIKRAREIVRLLTRETLERAQEVHRTTKREPTVAK